MRNKQTRNSKYIYSMLALVRESFYLNIMNLVFEKIIRSTKIPLLKQKVIR